MNSSMKTQNNNVRGRQKRRAAASTTFVRGSVTQRQIALRHNSNLNNSSNVNLKNQTNNNKLDYSDPNSINVILPKQLTDIYDNNSHINKSDIAGNGDEHSNKSAFQINEISEDHSTNRAEEIHQK